MQDVKKPCSDAGNGAFRVGLILMVSALQSSISLFFGSAYRSWCGRHDLLDGDFFSRLQPKKDDKEIKKKKKGKQERKFHVNSLKRFDLQKKKPANHKLNHTLFILKEN